MSNFPFFTPQGDEKGKFVIDILSVIYAYDGYFNIIFHTTKIISHLLGLLDRQNLKAALLPRIKSLCTSTTLLSVRQVYCIRPIRLESLNIF